MYIRETVRKTKNGKECVNLEMTVPIEDRQVFTVVLSTVGKGVPRIGKRSAPAPEPEHARIYGTPGVPLSHTVMVPVRTWSNA